MNSLVKLLTFFYIPLSIFDFNILFLTTNINFMNVSIGKKLKDLRKSKSFSMEIILEKLNISESTYMRMEKGETSSWTNYIDKICALYDIEVEELLLPVEKYDIICNNKNGVSSGSEMFYTTINKAIAVYEKMSMEKDKLIADLQNRLKET